MTKTLALIAAFTFAMSSAALADAYKMDAHGKCRDMHGRFAMMDKCKMHMMPGHMYKFDNKKVCRDEHGHFAKKDMCHA